jgi:hypothetical protein
MVDSNSLGVAVGGRENTGMHTWNGPKERDICNKM